MGETNGVRPTIKKDITDPETAGEYDPIEDIIHLNPELMEVSMIAEEFYHRKQDIFLRKKGITEEERNSQLYLTALEVGIIPRIRDIGRKKDNPEADYEFFRYVLEAHKFSRQYLSLSEEERKRFKEVVSGEKLFDGLAWVLEKLESSDYDPSCWERMAVDDSDGSKYWDEINESRRRGKIGV